MIEIQLAKGYIATVDDCDADLASFRWSVQVQSNGVYAGRTIKTNGSKKSVKLHRVIASRMMDRDLIRDEVVDHIDCNPLNNVRSNLRICSQLENTFNRRLNKNSTSGFKGVTFTKATHKWRAYIKVGEGNIHLGYHSTPEAAALAYNEAAIKHFGEFARLNEIPQTTNE